MRRKVEIPVITKSALPSPAGIVDPITYRTLKAVIGLLANGLVADMNPDNKRLKEGSELGGKMVDNLLKLSQGTEQRLSDESTEEVSEQLNDTGTLSSTGTGGGGGGTTIVDGTAQYQVLSWSGSAWIADVLRFHA